MYNYILVHNIIILNNSLLFSNLDKVQKLTVQSIVVSGEWTERNAVMC